ncbi:hypothetical protein NDU88_005007 [Pleurodeles waltl]|uniref:Uncharacterized protein n=1 Tax=Pleurodeles waltl TaxID=8319 RepID=A0AAV7VIL9_PLEWA|nr:hypothetical protein NDU88_005007 [Pleurodeles waltl]
MPLPCLTSAMRERRCPTGSGRRAPPGYSPAAPVTNHASRCSVRLHQSYDSCVILSVLSRDGRPPSASPGLYLVGCTASPAPARPSQILGSALSSRVSAASGPLSRIPGHTLDIQGPLWVSGLYGVGEYWREPY